MLQIKRSDVDARSFNVLFIISNQVFKILLTWAGLLFTKNVVKNMYFDHLMRGGGGQLFCSPLSVGRSLTHSHFANIVIQHEHISVWNQFISKPLGMPMANL